MLITSPNTHHTQRTDPPAPSALPPTSMTNVGDATSSSLAAQFASVSLEQQPDGNEAPPNAPIPTLTVEALPTVLLQEIARFVGLPEAASTVALSSRCLRSAYTTSVTGLTLTTAPLPTDLRPRRPPPATPVGHLAHHPRSVGHLCPFCCHPQWALPLPAHAVPRLPLRCPTNGFGAL